MDSAQQSFEYKRKTGSVLFTVGELVDDEGTIDSLSFGALATNFSTSESTQRNARVSVDELDQQNRGGRVQQSMQPSSAAPHRGNRTPSKIKVEALVEKRS